jgi:hypothetical protein
VSVLAAVVLSLLAQTPDLPIHVIDQGTQSRIEQPRQVVVDTSEAFAALWAEHSSRPVPAIDFRRESVVGIFAGTRPTAGYRVDVVAVLSSARGTTVVRYREVGPAPGAISAQVLTFPFVIFRAAKLTSPVQFESVR